MNASTTPKPGPFASQAAEIQGITAGEDAAVFTLTAMQSGCIHLESHSELHRPMIAGVLHSVAHQLGADDPGAGLVIADDDVLALAKFMNMPSADNMVGVHHLAQAVYNRAEDLVHASRSSRRG